MKLLFPDVVESELSEGFRVLSGQCGGYALHHRFELAEKCVPKRVVDVNSTAGTKGGSYLS